MIESASGLVARTVLHPGRLFDEIEKAGLLIQRVRELVGAPQLPFALLHEVYIEVKFDLALLDAVPSREESRVRRSELGHDPLLVFAPHLCTDVISAVVHSNLDFHKDLVDAKLDLPRWKRVFTTSARREAGWDRIAREDVPNLLGICTTLLMKVRVLCTLHEIPSDATSRIDAWKRLSNIRWLLRYLLRHLREVVPEEDKEYVFGTAPSLVQSPS